MPNNIKQKLEKFAEKCNVKLHILSRNEIENYVLNAELIYRTLASEPKNSGKTIPSIEEIQQKIDEALRETIRGGIYKYNLTLSEVLYKVKHNLLGESDYKTDDASYETDLTLGVFSETISESERTEQQEAYEQLSFFH